MKKLLLSIAIITTVSFSAFPQASEYGFLLGATEFWGDLGGGQGAPNLLRSVLLDTDIAQTRFGGGFMFRYNMSQFNAIRFNLIYARVDGNDGDANDSETYSRFRNFRSLSFHADIFEFSGQYEQNLKRYQIGRRKFKWTPYVSMGAGIFHMTPKAADGTNLRNLRTEGQGSTYYPDRKPYSQIQPEVLLGFGARWNISFNWSIGFEYGYRFTFTDYIDDVSKTYPVPAAMYEIHGDDAAAVNALTYSYGVDGRTITADNADIVHSVSPEAQRGNPADKDHYIFAGMITLTYTVARGKIYCPKF